MNLFNLRRSAPAVAEPKGASVSVPAAAQCSRERLMPSIERAPHVFVRGQGSWLWDDEGHAYLDFTQGCAVNSLGHSPSVLVKALGDQAQALINPGAGYHSRGLLNLAELLCQRTDSDQAYLLNSGAEACEGAIKLARKWGQLHRNGAYHIITASQGCHGRTLGALSASDPLPCNRCEPGLPGFSKVPFNDLAALHAAVDSRTVAIMLEPIQGEAGVIPATREYLQGVERLCRELGILLILDEVQTGVGRCGALLAEETYGVRADIITLGKGLGGGVPLAALLARGRACCAEPGELEGSHHGNALMSAAGMAVLQTVLEKGFFEQVMDSGRHLRDGLSRLAGRYGQGEVRGQGLLWGLQLREGTAVPLVEAALQEGLLLNAPQADVVRFSPALTVSKGNIDEMLQRLARAFTRLHAHQHNRREVPA
ncbi:aminotransferase class III-fold pyridoxal phosphate-dependent enzyme [Pseudomonas soli]|jgi:acetylornithine/N-succinyldiaminopimelate aminotransferase|uniref:Acetylornithine/N-succinyldiaminopimelate aminotransferase n=1 Tax=Pseudomonas soli TaxID=1306993 RepID=A0A1H9M8B6_9PSED|nr:MULTISPECIES: aminotransferase class III-fold pyridoxal phosphate-dependent enzyme [Pseudomonas]AUY34466.1 aspartate aminotransferase family protein [Pseudomonas sp. PONIH3]MCX5507965.1 aminotransferase class III-fold pyridoxal phosphate-dependent enzyme [Pseudomonas sp. BJa3]MDT3715287.1 aminotransferase class III-fold pyridoxal phosphate-dependent enzyme [Pseudomonas soli]MDT3731878.1 aminotransferase class III-fold pyridoxal phosphate-dependent enzyme [Pseudomonas soli]MEE1880286.1 amino